MICSPAPPREPMSSSSRSSSRETTSASPCRRSSPLPFSTTSGPWKVSKRPRGPCSGLCSCSIRTVRLPRRPVPRRSGPPGPTRTAPEFSHCEREPVPMRTEKWHSTARQRSGSASRLATRCRSSSSVLPSPSRWSAWPVLVKPTTSAAPGLRCLTSPRPSGSSTPATRTTPSTLRLLPGYRRRPWSIASSRSSPTRWRRSPRRAWPRNKPPPSKKASDSSTPSSWCLPASPSLSGHSSFRTRSGSSSRNEPGSWRCSGPWEPPAAR